MVESYQSPDRTIFEYVLKDFLDDLELFKQWELDTIDQSSTYRKKFDEILESTIMHSVKDKDWENFINFLKEAQEKTKKGIMIMRREIDFRNSFNDLGIKNTEITSLFDALIKYHTRSHYPEMARKAIFIFLISRLGGFLHSELLMLLLKKHDLINRNETITYGELLEISSEKDSAEEMTYVMIDKVLDKKDSIMESLSYLKEKTEYSAWDNKLWSQINERILRRNKIIHNNGIPDQKYYKEAGIPLAKQTFTKLDVDHEYLLETIDIFEEFAIDVSDYLEKKFQNEDLSEA